MLTATVLIVAGDFAASKDIGTFAATILLPWAGNLFFPFITGKSFFFRIAVEIIFAAWVTLAAFDKKYRPAASPILWAVSATLLALTLSTIFGENPYRSFWSNYERMEGLVGHIHLFLYFLILISVFKSERDWRRFFHASIFVSWLVAIYAIMQLTGKIDIHQGGTRIDATLGNATYLAMYMFFHLFLVLYYFLKTSFWPWRVFYILTFASHLTLLYYTATRGGLLGFIGGLVIAGLLLAIFGRVKKIKIAAVSVLAGVILIIGTFFLIKDTEFASTSETLSRFRGISLREITTESRFILWKMAWQGVKENPILGVGPDNFLIVFSKHYDPRMWRQEPWFDRAHNIFFDWLAAGGILGFLAYFSIFGAVFWALWRVAKTSGLIIETGLFAGLLAGYFFQNIFVFDNLISYFLFFSVLGFLHSIYANSGVQQKSLPAQAGFSVGLSYILPILVWVIILPSLYFVNLKPLLASRALIGALQIAATDGENVEKALLMFKKSFNYKTLGAPEAREQFAVYANTVVSFNLPEEAKIKALSEAVKEMQKQVTEYPKDPRGYLFLSSLYLRGGLNDLALDTLFKAKNISPFKQQTYFLIADTYFRKGEPQKAKDALLTAYRFDPNYTDAARNLVIGLIISGNLKEAEEISEKSFGAKTVADEQIASAYLQAGAYGKLRDIWLRFIKENPSNLQHRVNLAATYLKLGERNKAIAAIEEAIKINPDFKAKGESIIKEIR